MNDRDELLLDFESITNKQKLETIKNDMLNANKKFNEAKECLDNLKLKLRSTK